jgi:L-ornithine Nalpha-acyltransferase
MIVRFDDVFAPITAGNLTLRLAENDADVYAAQRLRYRIFCEEMGGVGNLAIQQQKRDFDMFDEACYHLLVIDNNRAGEARVVGTYRLLTRTNMQYVGSFYTETEYNIEKLKAFKGEIMELGRSCVEQQYRTRPVLQLLWQGIGSFIAAKDIALMFGCASFHGVNIKEHVHALSYLYHNHLAPENIRPVALPAQFNNMNLMPKEEVNARAALNILPPLIKGYIRLGGHVGDGAVLDYTCNTTDVSIVMETSQIKARYTDRYMPDAE